MDDLYNKITVAGKIKTGKLFSIYNKSQNNKRIMRTTSTKIDDCIEAFDELECKFDYGRLNMTVLVKTLTNKTIPVVVNNYCSIGDVKYLVQCKEGIPPEQQRLISQSAQLQNESTVEQCGLADRSSVHMVLRLRGS